MKENIKLSFVDKAKIIHGDKYIYSCVNYINAHTKIKIICPLHGEFEQTPNGHLNGNGCRECSKKIIGVKNSHDKNKFIEEANFIHNDKYDYSLVDYVNNKTKIKIICPLHGEFDQTPTSHLNMKTGCKKCGYDKANISKIKTFDEFLNQAKIIHGDKYSYLKSDYIDTNNKIKILCPTHGVFIQKPYKHLQNQGCPICKESKLEKKIRNLLLKHKFNFIQQYNKNSGCFWIGKQSFDFYLPDYNSVIECQGEQHFKPVDFGNKGVEFSDLALIKTIERDEIKFNLCKKHNVKIFYYTDKIECINGGYFDIVYTDEIEMINNIKLNKNVG